MAIDTKADGTTMSGGGLTLVTTLGGRPVGRRTIESWYEAKSTSGHADEMDQAPTN